MSRIHSMEALFGTSELLTDTWRYDLARNTFWSVRVSAMRLNSDVTSNVNRRLAAERIASYRLTFQRNGLTTHVSRKITFRSRQRISGNHNGNCLNRSTTVQYYSVHVHDQASDRPTRMHLPIVPRTLTKLGESAFSCFHCLEQTARICSRIDNGTKST